MRHPMHITRIRKKAARGRLYAAYKLSVLVFARRLPWRYPRWSPSCFFESMAFVNIPSISAQATVFRGDLAEGNGKVAYSGNEDYRSHKQVAVVVQIHLLKHFQAGYRNKAVKRYTYAAHYAFWDALKEAYKGVMKATAMDSTAAVNMGSIRKRFFRYCNAADGFTVLGGIGATAEDGAGN